MTSFTYDTNGNLETLTGPEGVSLAFKNDLLGRVLTATSTPPASSGLAPAATNFKYDAISNVTSVQPPGQPEHLFSFSPQGLESNDSPPLLASVPDTATTSTWDGDKSLTLESRPDGSQVRPHYDAASGRMTSVEVTGGYAAYSTGLTYDTAGRVRTVSATATAGGIETQTFDYAGPLVTQVAWSGVVSGVVSRQYDSAFRLQSEQVGSAPAVTCGYDDDGQPASAGALTLVRETGTGFLTGGMRYAVVPQMPK